MGIMKSKVSDDVETSIVVWVDGEINKKADNQKVQQRIQRIVSNFKAFEGENECEKYIRSISSKKRILLIINDRQGQQLIPHIHALQQVTTIYVYCQTKQGNEQWTNQFSKIKGIVRRLNELIFRIKTDQKEFLRVDKKCQSPPQFVYSQLLSNILLQQKSNKIDKTDLISLCKNIYKDSEFDLKIIHEFEQTYSNDKALWWYTRLTCFDTILNHALRTYDVNTILLFQFFIHDLYQQITECQCHYPVTVYRSQFMVDGEINSLITSVGCIISVHTFFSTFLDRDRAYDFLNAGDTSNGMYRVLFEIDADPNMVTTKPFANITKHSEFPKEREVLFTIGSLFRIISAQQSDDEVWIIRMTLCGDNDPDLEPLFDELENEYAWNEDEVALLSLIRVLREMEKFNEAANYCHRLLRDFSWNNSSLSVLYDELAQLDASKIDYDLSDQNQQKSIQSEDETDSSNSDDSNNNFRFTDVAAENHNVLLPIEGHEKMPLVTLEEAVLPLVPLLPDICLKAHTAKLNCKDPADGLTSDQSAAIMLYTMQWEPHDQCLYFVLNTHLRTADRDKLKLWSLYLKLILTGLSRLPSIERTVYRGVRLDLSSKHKEGDQFFWWGFSSCTTTINALKSDQFLGNNGIRTLFHIECMNGKDIRKHSYYQKEDEILLLPATYFEVTSCFEMAPGLHTVQLKEIKSKYPYLEPISIV